MSKELILTIQSFIKDIHNDKNDYQAQTETNINKKFELLNKRIRQAYDDKFDEKLDVELHPVFDTLFKLSRMHEKNKLNIEPL